MKPSVPAGPDRRTAIKWMLTAAASSSVLGRFGFAALAPTPPGAMPAAAPDSAATFAGGYGTDPDLVKPYQPGDLWPLTFTDVQRATTAALCAVIIPTDEMSPSAAEVGVQNFIDEWISAPYPVQAADRPLILAGLAWIEAEAHQRFGRSFVQLAPGEECAICDDICFPPKAQARFAEAAKFFSRFRDLTAIGFYTTPQGTKDVGYAGNVPLATFDGPPAEVLRKLELI